MCSPEASFLAFERGTASALLTAVCEFPLSRTVVHLELCQPVAFL